MLLEKYKKAWQKFEETMESLKSQRLQILKRIITKSNQEQLDRLRNDIKKYG